MPFRELENAANPVRSGGVLSLWSRSGELKSKPLSELSHVTGASRGAGCSAQFGWYRGYYSRPMERSVGRLFSSHFINFYWEDPMKELAKQFIGEECIIYTITSNDGSIQGVIKEIDDGGMVIERNSGEREIVNLDFVTRIRQYPRKKNGKKKDIVWD